MTERLRVLVVTPGLPPTHGGLERLALDVHEGLSALTDVCTVGLGPFAPPVAGLTRVAPGRLGALTLAAQSLLAIARFRPDVVLALTWKVAVPLLPFVGGRLCVYVHGAELIRPKGVLVRLRNAVTERAVLLLANSRFTESLAQSLTTTPTRVVSPGVRLPASDWRARDPKQCRVLSVGALVQRKGHDRLIRAAALAHSEGAKIALTIVGGGPLEPQLRALAEEMPPGLVEITGALGDDELTQRYASADVFALLGESVADEVEGFGIVLLEAAAHGLPVVATETGGTADAMRIGENAILVASVDEAAAAFRLLSGDGERRRQMGRASRDFSLQCTVEARAAEFVAAFNEFFPRR